MADRGNRPRVFHLITRLEYGGSEAKTIETVTRLDGYEFTVGHGSEYSPSQVKYLESAGVETRCFPLLRHYNPLAAVLAVFTIAWYLRRESFDIVHTHSTEAGIVGRLAGAIAGTPALIHTVHGVPFTEDRSRYLNRFVLACERIVAPLTDSIVTNADVIAEEYLERGIGRPGQYRTVYSGIPVEEYLDVASASDLPGERPRVLMVGRLVEGKGFDVLLDAIERTTCWYSVCIAGDGPLRDSLKANIVVRGLEDRVFLLGYRGDLPAVLAASDLFVLPSYREGTPRVISEAMASGLAVVATDIAGIPEQVTDGENGYLIPTGDPDALAEALDTLLDDEEVRNRMGRESRKRVDRFSVSKMVDDLDSLYRELLPIPSR